VAKARAKKKSKARPKSAPWRVADVPMDVPPREAWRPEWRDRATRLLVAYNDGLLAAPGRRKRAEAGQWLARGGSESTLAVLYAADVWARRRSIDPVVWAAWNGRRVRSEWTSRERMLALFDEARAQVFLADDLTNLNVAYEKDRELSGRLGESGFVVGRDLHHGAELAKWNFRQRGHEILCIDAHDLHFGFHARSTVCSSCSLKDRCERETLMRIEKRDRP
jgi:hypothetical protein